MTEYLIIFSTIDGHTQKICKFISEILKNKGNVKVISIGESETIDLSTYDCIIIGASIRYGKHRSNVYSFIEKNILILESKITAFFTVNVVARKKEKSDPETNPYMKKFIENVNWTPNYLAVFAGKIDFPKLKLFDRYVIKFIMWLTKGPTNTKECYDFTDWEKVKSFAEKM